VWLHAGLFLLVGVGEDLLPLINILDITKFKKNLGTKQGLEASPLYAIRKTGSKVVFGLEAAVCSVSAPFTHGTFNLMILQ